MMRGEIVDPEVQLLASIADALEADYTRPDVRRRWEGSPFNWIRATPSRQRGKIGEQLISGWCAAKGLNILRSGDAEADRVIEGRRVEVKFSTLWQNGGYTFQQIRDQRYSHLICLGVSPFSAHCWVIPKESGLRHGTSQHMGRAGSDTSWMSFRAAEPPDWLHEYGGTLRAAYAILETWRDTTEQPKP